MQKYKIGILFICTNQPYWEFAHAAIQGARQFLLPNHNREFLLWSDMPQDTKINATIIPTDGLSWPYPTLLRYHLFLNEEERLKQFDYLFYSDIDMRFVSYIGDEILGDGITAAQHPMYAVRRELIPPYEPNTESTAYIPRPGRLIDFNGKPRLEPLYFAGGFQGGKTESFLHAMKTIKKSIDDDLGKNYIAIWNDESHWNRYLFDNPPAVVLDPSYVYPDSLINEYYVKVWGRDFSPKIITLTKKFTVSKEAGAEVSKQLATW